MLSTADCGGSNGRRLRLRETELAAFAAEVGLEITVTHLQPGRAWNRIEHRLFEAISMNWRGRELSSQEVIMERIGAVSTRSGVRVKAALDSGIYRKGIRITDKDMKAFAAGTCGATSSRRLDYTVPRTWRPRHQPGTRRGGGGRPGGAEPGDPLPAPHAAVAFNPRFRQVIHRDPPSAPERAVLVPSAGWRAAMISSWRALRVAT